MKLISRTLFVSLLSVLIQAASAQAATIGISGTAPTPGPDDISAFIAATGYDGGQDFTDNYPVPGQTFTTLNAAQIYQLSSVTIQDYSAGNGFQSATYNFDIFSVSGSTLTFVAGKSFTFASTPADGDFLTFNLGSINLAPGTEYAFSLYRASGPGYLGLAGGYSSANTYSGGTGITINLNNFGNPSLGGTLGNANVGFDRNFDISLSAIPEPQTWALMLGGGALLFLVARVRRSVS
jgi:hypothetical protein